MKTLKTFAVTLLLAVFCITAQGLTPNEVSVSNSRKELQNSLAQKFSHSELSWDQQRNTEVVAEIYVNMEGKPEVKAINGDDVYKTYVVEKLKHLKMDKESLKGKSFICRFKFRTN